MFQNGGAFYSEDGYVTRMAGSEGIDELREQIEERMLDVVKSAAHMLNGDELKALEASDVGNEAHKKGFGGHPLVTGI